MRLESKICLICVGCLLFVSANSSLTTRLALSQDTEVSSWSAWASWTGCSSSCGAGLQLRQRICLKQSVSKFKRQALTSIGAATSQVSLHCLGEGKEYKVCVKESCSASQMDARSSQCAQLSKQLPYPDNLYRWTAFFNDSGDPCALVCQTEERQSSRRVRQLATTVSDATPCGRGTDSICLEGRCVPVGCDGRLFSLSFFDQCGICGGDGSACKRIRGTYNKRIPTAGFKDVVRIPEGAADLNIRLEPTNFTNLVVQTRHGGLIFSGLSRQIFALGEKRSVGRMTLLYRRFTYDEPTVLTTSQKLMDDLYVKVLVKRNVSLVWLAYEYTVPINVSGSTSTSTSTSSSNRHPSTINVHPRTQLATEPPTEFKPLRHDVSTSTPTSSMASTPENFEGIKEDGDVTPLPRLFEENAVMQQLWETNSYDNYDWEPLRLELEYDDDVSDEEAGMTSEVAPVSLGLNESVTSPQEPSGPVSVEAEHPRFRFPWESVETGLAPGTTFSWKTFGPIHCSSTCTPGRVFEYAHCERSDGVLVNDSYCVAKARPLPEPTSCAGKLCDARWVAGHWSECSVSCGSGVQQRFVRCWRVLSRGLDSTVHPYMCEEALRPLDVRQCDMLPCEPQWHVASWQKCSAVCGSGVETREVRCSRDDGATCPLEKRPSDTRSCFLQPCITPGVWVAEQWSQCSGQCGTGIRSRGVFCRGVRGSSLAEDQCSANRKPLSREPCDVDAVNCSAHWVPQEWTKCSVECGIGNQTREVLCSGLKGGRVRIFREKRCRRFPRPPSFQSCRATLQCQRQWFASPWSQCSASCDGGFRMREVVCGAVDNGLPCDLNTKPSNRESCTLPPCPTPKPADLEETKCADFPTTKCELVLKVRLCEHWFYKKACCKSCSERQSSP